MARRLRGYVALALVLAVAVAGCGDASPDIRPSGVDELVIPTPSPDPDDFVRRVDNPWLPLAPGSTWRYAATVAGQPDTVVVEVLDRDEHIAGVVTTAVQRSAAAATSVDFYAQDRSGNVWWFGHEGDGAGWRAGEDGAQAGLAMPATPRLGDGWRTAYDAGVVDPRATVEDVGETLTLPAGRFEGLLVIDTVSPLAPGVTTRSSFARGTGLVQELTLEGPDSLLRLESGPA